MCLERTQVTHVYVVRKNEVVKVSNKIKEKYQSAEVEIQEVQQEVSRKTEEFKEIDMATVSFMKQGRQCLARLDKIALRPNPLSITEYIDTLKRNEESTAAPGWQRRFVKSKTKPVTWKS